MEEYRNRFDKLLAPVAFLQTVVIEETIMNGLSPWLKTEVDALEPVGLARIMKLALKRKNREIVQKESGLVSVYGSKVQNNLPRLKEITNSNATNVQGGGNVPMRTITLRGVTAAENRREGPTKRLSDAEFQSRREKGLCFLCVEK